MMNLVAEMARYGIKKKDVYEFLSMSDRTFSNRLDGNPTFTVKEAFSIRDHFFPGYTIEYLFTDAGEIKAG
jgi:hypothetical protein